LGLSDAFTQQRHLLAFGRGNLLAGDRQAFATAARTRVGLGALTASGQTPTMALPAVAVDFNHTFDIETFDTSQVAFDLQAALLDLIAQATHFVFSEVLDASGFRDSQFLANFIRRRMSNSVDIRQGDVSAFSSGKIHSGNSGHVLVPFLTAPSLRFVTSAQLLRCIAARLAASLLVRFLSLSLFVLRIFANDRHPPFTADNFALVADFLNGCSDFHDFLFCNSLS
jgi:hypothetical protein